METPHIHLTRGMPGCTLAVARKALTVVVDALRASATIAVLLQHGVRRILVVAGVGDALRLARNVPDAVLVGERGGERLPGFHLGNSPLEVISSPRMDGRTVIFTSSNGAQRLAASCGTDCVLVGTTVNAGALVDWMHRALRENPRPVVLVAAGKFPDETFISPEDDAACAVLAERLGLPIAVDSQDAFTYRQQEITSRGLEGIFRSSAHARRLMEIGYSEDVLFCARIDTVPIVPIVTGLVRLDGEVVGVEVEKAEGNLIT